MENCIYPFCNDKRSNETLLYLVAKYAILSEGRMIVVEACKFSDILNHELVGMGSNALPTGRQEQSWQSI